MQNVVDSVLRKIDALRQKSSHLLIAIDGRCAAGKTTLATRLQKACGCNVIPMDHFFLRPEQRTAERLNTPGGNVDYERFLKEALIPLKQGEMFSYHPYDCHRQEFTEAVQVVPNPVNIIDGSYSCHPALYENYDLMIFLTVDEAEQIHRIRYRNGEICTARFQQKWIPLEERYFSAYHIKERCNLYFQTGEAYLGR